MLYDISWRNIRPLHVPEKGGRESTGRSHSRWHRRSVGERRGLNCSPLSGSTPQNSGYSPPCLSHLASSPAIESFDLRSGGGGVSDAGSGSSPTTTLGRRPIRSDEDLFALPTWPLLLMFGFMPLWWGLGMFYLAWPLFGVLLLVILAVRGGVKLPAGTGLWLVFLCLVLISFTRLGRTTELLTAGFRFSFYLTALVVCVYCYNLARERATIRPLWRPLCYFWLGLVALGWVGVLVPQLAMASVAQVLLPGSIATEPFIFDMVYLTSTEAQSLATNPRYRPSAPFAYTNTWGSSWAILLPCVIAYLMAAPSGWLRRIVIISIPLSLVPAFLTLNRVMFASLAVGLCVVALRAMLKGDRRLVLAILGLVALGWVATLFIPVFELIEDRVSSSGTNDARMFLYSQVLHRVQESPLFGHGAPVSVDTIDAPPIGSQGQLWLVLFSHGIPALVVFIGWFLAVSLRTAGAGSPTVHWLGAVPVVGLAQMPFYGLTFQNLSLIFFAVGMLLASMSFTQRPATPLGADRVDVPARPEPVVG